MPDEEYKTSYSPGDLYDLLSTSSETRFHACYLFFRYFLFVSSPEDGVSVKDEGIQAVVWDVAVACLALSVKVSVRLSPSTQRFPDSVLR